MKLKQITILLAVLAAAIVGLILNKGTQGDAVDAGVGKRVLDEVRQELSRDVTNISLNAGKEEVNLEIKDGKWVVSGRDGFWANEENIVKLVTKAFKMVALDVKEAPDKHLGRFKLQAPGTGGKESETGTQVTFKKQDGTQIASFRIGKNPPNTAAPGGFSNTQAQYIKNDSVKDKVFVIKEAFDYFMNAITNKDWLDKTDFIKVDKPKSITVTSAKPEENWTIFREKEGTDVNELKLKDAKPDEEFDPNKGGNSATAFASAAFNDVATAEQKAKAGLEAPARTAVIETFDGFKYTIKVGNQAEKPAGTDPNAGGSDEYYVSFEVEASLPEKMPEPAPIADDKRTEEEKKKAREEAEKKFADDLAKSKEKLTKEKALAGKVFVLPKFSVDPLLKNRAEFMKEKPAEGVAPSAPGEPPAPPVGHAPMPAPVKSEPVTATTPPISVDIKPTPESKPAVEAKPEEPKPKVDIKVPEEAPAKKPAAPDKPASK